MTKDLPGFTLRLGPLVITWRSLFVAKIRYQPRSLTGHKPPLFERPTVQEDEEPYRRGHARVFRLWPLNRALMLGWWGDPMVGDEVGEHRALVSLLSETGTIQPVTKLFGAMSPEELAEHAARHAPPPAQIPEDFQIIEWDDDAATEAHS